MEMHRRFEYDITPIEAMQTTLLTECGIRMDVNLNSYTNYNTQVDWHPIKTHNDHRKTYMHLAEKADDLFKPAYRAYGECNLKDLITAVDDIYAKYNELEAKYQEQCKMISEYEEDKQKTDKLMLEFQERYFDAEKQLKEVKADNEDLECQLNSNYLAKKLADEQEARADAEKKLTSLQRLLEAVQIRVYDRSKSVPQFTRHHIADGNWKVVFDEFEEGFKKEINELKEKLADEQRLRAMSEAATRGLRQERNDAQDAVTKLEEKVSDLMDTNKRLEEKERKLMSLRDLLESEGIHVVPWTHTLLLSSDAYRNADWTIIFKNGKGTSQTQAQLEVDNAVLRGEHDEFEEKYEKQKRRNLKLAQKSKALGLHIAELCDEVHELKKDREEHIFEPITKDTVNCAFCKLEGALGIDIGPMDADVVWRANRILKGIYDLKDKSSYVQFDCPFHTNPENGI